MTSPPALDAVFRDALGPEASREEGLTTADLEARWAQGRAAWPGVELDAVAFVQGLATRATPDVPLAEHAADLYLACACANGSPAALAAFERAFGSTIDQSAARVDPSPTFRDELMQVLRQQLFVGPGDKPPKIAEYGGRAPLRSWLRVVAKRAALNLRRGSERSNPSAHSLHDDAAVATDAAPELAYMKALYKDHFEEAIRVAFRGLSSRDRTLLRLHLSERMTLAQLGAVYDVSHSTIARWLTIARDMLVTEMRKALAARLTLTSSEYESVVALVRSQLDVQLVELLQSSSGRIPK